MREFRLHIINSLTLFLLCFGTPLEHTKPKCLKTIRLLFVRLLVLSLHVIKFRQTFIGRCGTYVLVMWTGSYLLASTWIRFVWWKERKKNPNRFSKSTKMQYKRKRHKKFCRFIYFITFDPIIEIRQLPLRTVFFVNSCVTHDDCQSKFHFVACEANEVCEACKNFFFVWVPEGNHHLYYYSSGILFPSFMMKSQIKSFTVFLFDKNPSWLHLIKFDPFKLRQIQLKRQQCYIRWKSSSYAYMITVRHIFWKWEFGRYLCLFLRRYWFFQMKLAFLLYLPGHRVATKKCIKCNNVCVWPI